MHKLDAYEHIVTNRGVPEWIDVVLLFISACVWVIAFGSLALFASMRTD